MSYDCRKMSIERENTLAPRWEKEKKEYEKSLASLKRQNATCRRELEECSLQALERQVQREGEDARTLTLNLTLIGGRERG